MDKIYNKAMKSLLPEVLKPLGFEVIEVAKKLRFSALSDVYVTLAYDPLWIFLEIRPHLVCPQRNETVVKCSSASENMRTGPHE